jgi:hypothetical protein
MEWVLEMGWVNGWKGGVERVDGKYVLREYSKCWVRRSEARPELSRLLETRRI